MKNLHFASTFFMSSAGTLLSILGFFLFVGNAVAPPVFIPLLFGLGIGMTAFSLVKWSLEEIYERQDVKDQEKKSSIHKEIILDAALAAHEHQLKQHVGSCWALKCSSCVLKSY